MKTLLVTLTLTLFTSTLYASGNHFHPKKFAKCKTATCTEQELKDSITASVVYLSEWKKIDLSWAKASVEKMEQKQFKKGVEWMVTLVDSTPAKQKRFVFFTLDGYVTGSNASGN
jgi:hypothetical protein